VREGIEANTTGLQGRGKARGGGEGEADVATQPRKRQGYRTSAKCYEP